MSQKFNPYSDLKRRFNEFVTQCLCRHTKSMWTYPKARLGDNWTLDRLWERVAAAEQIGYDVQIRATDEGLSVQYVKKLPMRPFDI